MARERETTVKLNKVLPRVETAAKLGLTAAQASERLHNGYGNESPEPPERTVGQIVRANVFTYFNLIFLIFAVCITAVGAYNELTFLPVVAANVVIGIVQELRSRHMLRSMTIITAPRAVVIRDGAELEISAEKAVLDDVARFGAGTQIYADAVVLSGECSVNEALVTGEADEITKTAGDTLLSGSFVVSGECLARLDKVGRDSFVSQLTLEAKKSGKKNKSGMMYSLTRLVQVIGFIIIPFGAIMVYQQLRVLGEPFNEGVISTIAALIGMIPEGLYLLVSVALTVSIMRLAKKRTLVHEMRCIETLARVDVLCVDKTGTITEPNMRVTDTVLLCEDRFSSEDVTLLMTDYAAAHGDDNETMKSLKEYFSGKPKSRATKVMAFSSAFKYSGASFAGGTYFLGAPEKILLSDFESWRGEIDKYASQGYRVLLLAMGDGELDGGPMRPGAFPIALILLTNKIRAEAPAAFRFFAEQGVDIKVISGDSPATVSQIAGEAGIANADKYVDASTLTTQRKILRAVREYTVFGRVTPDQKRKLIRAIKADGHTVAMTGDGVNDVLALKDADCSIAMASGSDVACHVAQLVLLDSNFGAMPSVVMEGRRVINNIERSSSLFLVKNIFSFLLTVIVLGLTLSYPMKPSQLSLFNVMFIGVPSFVLALEPNKSRVRGHFLPNVILTALPAGLTSLFAVLAAVYATDKFALPQEQLGALSTILISFVGLMTLIRVSLPLNSLRRVLVIAMVAGFVTGSFVLRDLFSMADFSWRAAGFAAVIAVICVPVMFILTYVVNMFRRRKKPRKVVVADDYGE